MKKRIIAAVASLSATGLVTIAGFEGYRGQAYDDGVGVQTVGFGSTAGVKRGDRTDPVRALVRLGEDAASHERGLRACVTAPVYPWEWDALVSWTYNVGTGAACRSTLVRKLNAGDYAGACAELLRWTKAGGRTLPGLLRRRQTEYRICTGGDPRYDTRSDADVEMQAMRDEARGRMAARAAGESYEKEVTE